MRKLFITVSVIVLFTISIFGQQTTAFSYQGKLNSSSIAANGSYDFKFELYNVVSGGSPIGTVLKDGVQVTNGIFTVQLDFAASAFDGNDRYLDIAVKPPAGSYTALTPRQKLASVPYAIKSILSDTATVAQTAINSTSLGGISASSFLLNNGDGSQLSNLSGAVKWNLISNDYQAQTNNGYLIKAPITLPNDVMVTLPANPQVGDIVRVASASLREWGIAQNSGQSIIRHEDYTSRTWSRLANSPVDAQIESSGDGSVIMVASNTDYYGSGSPTALRISRDFGRTWTIPNSTVRNWRALAASADGSKLFAAISNGTLLVSTDFGVTWTPREQSRIWSCIASSADGTKLVAAAYGGNIYVSTDSGNTWSPKESPRSWISVASSADGTKLIAAEAFFGQVYTSSDSGETWVPRNLSAQWESVASSADGTRLLACANLATNGQTVYMSTNSGANWTPLVPTSLPSGDCRHVKISANGRNLAMSYTQSSPNSGVYTSKDYGASWSKAIWGNSSVANIAVPSVDGLTMTTDGSRIYGLIRFGSIGETLFANPQDSITTVGTTGNLKVDSYGFVELVYIGEGKFLIVNSKGTLRFN